MTNKLSSLATTSKGVIVIPAKNEAETVGEVVRCVREHVGWDVVVVDDASVDETSERASTAGADVVRLPLKVGAWGAVISVLPGSIDWIAAKLDISYPPTLVMLIGMALILVRMLKLDIERSRGQQELRILAQRLALLRAELRTKRTHKTPTE